MIVGQTVWTQSTSVTDRRTDRQTDRQTDGQTDRITITKTVQRRASHGKNCYINKPKWINTVVRHWCCAVFAAQFVRSHAHWSGLKLSSRRLLIMSIAVSIPFARRRESVSLQLFQLVMLKLTSHPTQTNNAKNRQNTFATRWAKISGNNSISACLTRRL